MRFQSLHWKTGQPTSICSVDTCGETNRKSEQRFQAVFNTGGKRANSAVERKARSMMTLVRLFPAFQALPDRKVIPNKNRRGIHE